MAKANQETALLLLAEKESCSLLAVASAAAAALRCESNLFHERARSELLLLLARKVGLNQQKWQQGQANRTCIAGTLPQTCLHRGRKPATTDLQ